MFGMTMGVLVGTDIEKAPEAAVLGSLEDIQSKVGGIIDAVRMEFGDDDAKFTLVGYVHDEGLLLDLPLNYMASMLFERELRGPVVLVSGTNPESKEYDGENYDIPSEFFDFLSGYMHNELKRAFITTKFMAMCMQVAHEDKAISASETKAILKAIMEVGEKNMSGTGKDLPAATRNLMSKAIAHVMTNRLGIPVRADETQEGE